MDTRTTIQKERDKKKERIVRLFIRYRSTATKTRAAELVAGSVGCSKTSVINTINDAGKWN